MRVKHTVQSPGNEPVTYSYTRSGVDAVTAINAVTSLMAMDWSSIPEASRPRTLAINIDFEVQ